MSASMLQFFAIVIAFQIANVVGYTTRSYDLEVPGSKPIRIIEADPGWDINQRRNDSPQTYSQLGDKDDRYNHPDFEHRTLKPDIISNRNDRTSAEINNENSEKLKQFLNNYAQNFNYNKNSNVGVEAIDNIEDELILKDKFVDDIETEEPPKPEKSKSWNLLHFEKISSRPQDQKGWVSMDAVPWSVSKISKWHGKPKKDKYPNTYYDHVDNRPYIDRFSNQDQYPRPSYPKPPRPNFQRPAASSYYDDVDEDDVEDPVIDDDYYNKRPTFSRPAATYGHKVNVQTVQTYGGNKRPQKHDGVNCNHQGPTDIITDGQPANFPDHDYGNRRRGVASDTIPSTHPFKGDVLPPLRNGKVNMTTSHGGLLQVDASFQSVEDAQKAYVKKQKHKNRPIRRPTKIRLPQQYQTSQLNKPKQQQQKLNKIVTKRQPQIKYQMQASKEPMTEASSTSDASAVLAAVGAGMIPASMALLVPMAMSGKRRKREIPDYNSVITRNPYTDTIELTLPSSL